RCAVLGGGPLAARAGPRAAGEEAGRDHGAADGAPARSQARGREERPQEDARMTVSPSAQSASPRPTDEPFVRLRGVEKTFQQGGGTFHVLRRIGRDVAAGEFVSIMGPSGAGKSTLLHLIGLQDHDWTGAYRLDGRDVEDLDAKARNRLRNENIGFVF